MTTKEEQIARLRECPFCGNKALVEKEILRHQIIGPRWHGHCIVCGASGSPKKTREEAAKSWNTRASDAIIDQLQGEVARWKVVFDELCKVHDKEAAACEAAITAAETAQKQLAHKDKLLAMAVEFFKESSKNNARVAEALSIALDQQNAAISGEA